jgi:dihydroneopterin aldolase
MPADVIRIKNASFYAYHGVARDEQNLGGKFEIDVELRSDLSAAMQSDDLHRTVNYETVYASIKKIVTSKKYFLLEALANSLAVELLNEYAQVHEITVRVRKPHPPVKGVIDYVEVEVTKQK